MAPLSKNIANLPHGTGNATAAAFPGVPFSLWGINGQMSVECVRRGKVHVKFLQSRRLSD